MERVRLDLDSAEYRALAQMADRRLRPIPLEARYIVREALEHAGLLAGPVSEQRAAGMPPVREACS